jgi:hypothetical protein
MAVTGQTVATQRMTTTKQVVIDPTTTQTTKRNHLRNVNYVDQGTTSKAFVRKWKMTKKLF